LFVLSLFSKNDVTDKELNIVSCATGHMQKHIMNLLEQAQEIDDDPNKQFGNTTAITDVTITVEDVNDNLPKFGSTTYNATIQENTPKNVPITLLSPAEIMIYDADQVSLLNTLPCLLFKYLYSIYSTNFFLRIAMQNIWSNIIRIR
jgi:hypothetical protein